MKTCYTVILGGYDTLRNPEVITPGWRYICITDTPEICEGTIYQPINTKTLRMRCSNIGKEKASRIYKWRGWVLSEDISIYHDGNFAVQGNLDEFVSQLESKYFATRPHPSRTNVLDEIDACLVLDKDTPHGLETLRKWIEKELEPAESEKWKEQYKGRTHWFYPDQHGLYENGILFFNPKANKYNLEVLTRQVAYAYVSHSTHRDQPILPFVSWYNSLPIPTIDRNHAANYFKYHKTHLK